MSAAEDRRLRTDAERNRARIIEAATAAFARRGLNVPLEEVAEEAGVGIGTLYRRFSRREDLIGACFERRLAQYADAAEEALGAQDGWTGFVRYVERVCAMQAADRGLADVLNRSLPNAKVLEKHRSRGYGFSIQLIERAQAEGSLRPDVVAEDLALLLMANAGVIEVTHGAANDAWRRFLAIFLDGLRPEGATTLPPTSDSAPDDASDATSGAHLASSKAHLLISLDVDLCRGEARCDPRAPITDSLGTAAAPTRRCPSFRS